MSEPLTPEALAAIRARAAEGTIAPVLRRDLSELLAEVEWLSAAHAEALSLLADVTNQACRQPDGTLDSLGMRDYADALRFFARVGQVEITAEAGKRVKGRWIEKGAPDA